MLGWIESVALVLTLLAVDQVSLIDRFCLPCPDIARKVPLPRGADVPGEDRRSKPSGQGRGIIECRVAKGRRRPPRPRRAGEGRIRLVLSTTDVGRAGGDLVQIDARGGTNSNPAARPATVWCTHTQTPKDAGGYLCQWLATLLATSAPFRSVEVRLSDPLRLPGCRDGPAAARDLAPHRRTSPRLRGAPCPGTPGSPRPPRAQRLRGGALEWPAEPPPALWQLPGEDPRPRPPGRPVGPGVRPLTILARRRGAPGRPAGGGAGVAPRADDA